MFKAAAQAFSKGASTQCVLHEGTPGPFCSTSYYCTSHCCCCDWLIKLAYFDLTHRVRMGRPSTAVLLLAVAFLGVATAATQCPAGSGVNTQTSLASSVYTVTVTGRCKEVHMLIWKPSSSSNPCVLSCITSHPAFVLERTRKLSTAEQRVVRVTTTSKRRLPQLLAIWTEDPKHPIMRCESGCGTAHAPHIAHLRMHAC